ncbi:MAG: hypothetical protein HN348_15010 [Proteobacteria bacterium]|jgi:hypothetical protein|nr:hypothetical protein [Pseudomonadota bacterium]
MRLIWAFLFLSGCLLVQDPPDFRYLPCDNNDDCPASEVCCTDWGWDCSTDHMDKCVARSDAGCIEEECPNGFGCETDDECATICFGDYDCQQDYYCDRAYGASAGDCVSL